MTAEQIAIISLATNVSLVVVTTAYVVLTWRMAGAAKAAANFAAESAAAARSSLSIEFQLLSLTGTSPAGVSGVFPKKWRRCLCREFVDVSES